MHFYLVIRCTQLFILLSLRNQKYVKYIRSKIKSISIRKWVTLLLRAAGIEKGKIYYSIISQNFLNKYLLVAGSKHK